MSVSHKKERLLHRGRHRAPRAKTFSTEAAAKKWAELNGIKNFKVVAMKEGLSKKLMVVATK